MTTYILHGGFNPDLLEQEDDLFFTDILKDAPLKTKILLVYFAVREERIELRTTQDKTSFTKIKGSKDLEFKIASEENFLQDCNEADVIYLHGGSTARLMDQLQKYSLNDVANALKGKIVAADSAGVNALAVMSYSKTSKEIQAGLGILPFKVVVHYVEGDLNPLQDTLPELDTICIKEYETKRFCI
jgi:peptidase E